MSTPQLWLVAIAIAIGLVGILVPVIPGIWLVLGAVLVWAIVEGDAGAWVVFGIAAALVAVSQVVKIVIPGKRLKDAGVPTRSLVGGAIGGIICFFLPLLPVIGVIAGFVGGVYLMERRRLGTSAAARTSTIAALKAAGLSVAIELAAGLTVAVMWAVSLLVT